jgi:gamma-glutamyltranspeptidase / glutathione hydrolase
MDIWNSRRSPVYASNGIVASSQPLASEIGVSILKAGGNAADAAIAVAAALNMTEPTSTGIGGDAFCLYYDSASGDVRGLNGSGRAPKALSIESLNSKGITKLDPYNINTITVPGAAAAWVDTVQSFGTMELKQVLEPVIKMGKNGFPVQEITARFWQRGAETQLKKWPYADEMLIDGRGPKPGEIMRNLTLANTFELLVEHGKAGFYEGEVADSIIDVISQFGGTMTHEDLKSHHTTFDDPISVNYRGIDVFEIPPNGQGITALMALNMLEEFDLSTYKYHSFEHLHLLIELMRIAFADTRYYVADPSITDVPTDLLISKNYSKTRSKLFHPSKASKNVHIGSPFTSSDTVYFTVVDKYGNACSFINSNYMGFGTGLIPKGCGFTLQNRGHNFSLDIDHPNALSPNKRPYHTIIPGLALEDGQLYSSFGVMGGFMQPQGHVQVISNMVDFGMNPQQALDQPRFCINDGTSGGKVNLEEGIPINVMSQLSSLGHDIIPTSGYARSVFGRGQIINRDNKSGVLVGGSDPRADGLALGY